MPFWSKKPKEDPVPFAILDMLKEDNGATSFKLLRSPIAADDVEGSSVANGQANGDTLPQAHPASINGNGTIKSGTNASQMTAMHHDTEVYKSEIVKKKLSKDQARLLRGDGTLFATLKGQHVIFAGSGASINRRDIVYHATTFGARKLFSVDGQEYVFEESSKYRDKCFLYPTRKKSSSKHSKPLAVFEVWPVSRTHRGQIRIYEPDLDIDTMLDADAEDNVTPTRLMDIALIAYFILLSFKWNESIVQSLQDPK